MGTHAGGKSLYHSALQLSALCAAAFLLQKLLPSFTSAFILQSSLAASRPWTLLTAIFLHANAAHLLANLFGLALFGSILEAHIGTRRFLLLFFASGIAANILAIFFYPAVLGASGAIFGVIGALAVLRPTLVVWVDLLPMPMIAAAGAWALQDILGVLAPAGVANLAHLAGLGFGLVFGTALRRTNPEVLERPLRKQKLSEKEQARLKQQLDEWERQQGLR